MKILLLGGTRYFGIHLVNALLDTGHDVTIATRGINPVPFSGRVKQVIIDRYDANSFGNIKKSEWDLVYDNLAYASNDVKTVLENLVCDKYIMTSSSAVYVENNYNMRETEFNPMTKDLVWCSRGDFSYGETKRQAECALFQQFHAQKSLAVRLPYVVGLDDYTKRLRFYIEHAIHGLPMAIDNMDRQLSFISSMEAGKFLAHLSSSCECGPINGSSIGTISIHEILEFTASISGKRAILHPNGDSAPYNGDLGNSLCVDKAIATGFEFSKLKTWIYSLIEDHVGQIKQSPY